METDDAYYQYRGGQRSRKLVVKQGGITEERIYLGNYEIFRSFTGQNLDLERKTVHISDDGGRIAMYEYRTQGWDNSPQELMRCIYSNNLSSAMLELDDNGQIISYEEYHPFGTTAYQATNASINAVAKRYRYTGKERDEESGLYYHGARYYIPWLCRWTQCDPIGIKDGLNVYAYVSNNPVKLNDPQGTQAQGREEVPESGKGKPIEINIPRGGMSVVNEDGTVCEDPLLVASPESNNSASPAAKTSKPKKEVSQYQYNWSTGSTSTSTLQPSIGTPYVMVTDSAAVTTDNVEQQKTESTGNVIDITTKQKVSTMNASTKLGEFAETFEGLKLEIYDDNGEKKGGFATIGIGHLIHKGEPGTNPTAEAPFKDGITKEKAYELYAEDMATAVKAVKSVVTIDLTQNQFDALVSFAYNAGGGNLKNSTLLKKVNSGASADEITEEFAKWVNSDGQKLAGLYNRRMDEAELFNNGDYKRDYYETKKSLGW